MYKITKSRWSTRIHLQKKGFCDEPGNIFEKTSKKRILLWCALETTSQ